MNTLSIRNGMKTPAPATSGGLTLTSRVHFRHGGKGKLELTAGPQPPAAAAQVGRIPKISRLMALAIRFQGLLERKEVKDYAELARLGHVTRARLTQVMNLTLLAPDLQEKLLTLSIVTAGRDPIKEWQVRPIAAESMWAEQRKMWKKLAAISTIPQ